MFYCHKITLPALLAAAFFAAVSAMPARAGERLNLDINSSFAWDGKSIAQVADSTARILRQRCTNGCTLVIRIDTGKAPKRGLEQRITWLGEAILDRLDAGQKQYVEIVSETGAL